MTQAGKIPTKNSNNSVPVFQKCLCILLWALPAIWLFHLISIYGVDIPHSDSWDGECPLFMKDQAGTLGVSDFFAQHNEHRIFFPRLIMFSLAKMTHLNVYAELWAMWVLAVISALNIWLVARATGCNSFRTPWLIFLANLFIFSPLGHENWLFGFQIGFLLPLACYTAVLWMAPAIRFPFNFLLTFVVCTICTLSIASGFTCWLMTLPLLLLPDFKVHWQERRGWWVFWIAGFLGTTLLYFRGYHKPAQHPDPFLFLSHPLQAFRFLLAYWGNPFSQGTFISAGDLAQITGFILFVAFIASVFYVWRWRHDKAFVTQTLPWFILSSVALILGSLVTIGRFGFGIDGALPPRYITFCSTLPIALIFLIPLIYRHASTHEQIKLPRLGMVISGFAGALLGVYLLGAYVSEANWKLRNHLWLTTKAVVELIDVVDDREAIAGYVHSEVDLVKMEADVLDKCGYLHPGLLHSKNIAPIAASQMGDSPKFGQIQQAGKASEGQFGMMGWAILPDKLRIADIVLLTYDNAQGEPTIFAIAPVGIPRPEVASNLGQANYDRAGWGKAFNYSLLPPGAGSIRAWAFDAEDCRAYPLQGVASAVP